MKATELCSTNCAGFEVGGRFGPPWIAVFPNLYCPSYSTGTHWRAVHCLSWALWNVNHSRTASPRLDYESLLSLIYKPLEIEMGQTNISSLLL